MATNPGLLKTFKGLAAVLGLLCLLPLSGLTQEKTSHARPARKPHLNAMSRHVLHSNPIALYYYTPDSRGLQSFQAHASQMTLVAPQCYWIEKDGVVRGEVPPRLVEQAQKSRIPLMPLLYNRGFDRATVTRLLRSTEAQHRAVSYMGYLAGKNNFAGFQIDFENIDPADHWRFSSFVRLVAERMHRDGRLLSVAVVPRFSDARPGDGRKGEPSTGEWSAAFDYPALASAADFLTLMTYDHSNRTSPAGPIAGYEWVEKALKYALSKAPAHKFMLGIPLYGREWVQVDKKLTSRSMSAQDIQFILSLPGVEPSWDEKWRSPWLQIRDGNGVRTVWYENARSWAEKLALIRKFGLCGFGAWRLGFEGPDYWGLVQIKSEETAKPDSAPTVP